MTSSLYDGIALRCGHSMNLIIQHYFGLLYVLTASFSTVLCGEKIVNGRMHPTIKMHTFSRRNIAYIWAMANDEYVFQREEKQIKKIRLKIKD